MRLLPTAVAITLAVSVIHVSLAEAAGPVHRWSKQFGGTGEQQAGAMAWDPAGNLVLVGEFTNTVNFGGPPLTASGTYDVFLAKLDPSGGHIWSKGFGVSGLSQGISVAVSATGEIVIGGYVDGTIDFGGGPLTGTEGDAFVAKFDANGTHLWSARFGNSKGQGTGSVAFDSGHNVLVAGWSYGGSIDLGGGLFTARDMDGWVAKFDPSGAHLWSRQIGDAISVPQDSSYQFITNVAVDPSDDVVITGVFRGTTDFGAGPISAISQDMFLARYHANGAYVRNQTFSAGTFNLVNANAMTIDASGNVTVGGVYEGSPDLGGGPLPFGDTGFVASFDATGAHRWSHGFQGYANVFSIGAGPGGEVSITGVYTDSLNVGGDWMAAPSPGFDSIFIAKFDADGAHRWSKGFGRGNGNQTLMDNTGDVFLTGFIDGSQPVSFGGDSFTPHGRDVFLARFGDADLTPVLITHFDAAPGHAGVALRWELWSDEDIESITLLRAEGASAQSVVAEISDPRTRSFVDRSAEAGHSYRYELVVNTRDGGTFASPLVTATLVPLGLAIGENRPNPFNPETTIPYQLAGSAQPQHVELRVLDAAGREVRMLVDEDEAGGSHSVVWNGRDDHGNAVASGVYFSVLHVGKEQRTSKMVMLK